MPRPSRRRSRNAAAARSDSVTSTSTVTSPRMCPLSPLATALIAASSGDDDGVATASGPTRFEPEPPPAEGTTSTYWCAPEDVADGFGGAVGPDAPGTTSRYW